MSYMLFCGRERGYFLLGKLMESGLLPSSIIIMKDDEHEIDWSDRIAYLASEQNIPFEIGKSLNSSKLKSFYLAHLTDLVLLENWRTLIPEELYSLSKHFVVFHESLLPKYKGFAPLVWPIINGETKTGVTMFYISDEVDSGDIIDQVTVPIDYGDSCNDLFFKTFNAYLNLCIRNIPNILKGAVSPTKQRKEHSTYACMRTPEDGHIDWRETTPNIYNFIRAQRPPLFPGAFSFYDDQKLVIAVAEEVLDGPVYVGNIPGKIVHISQDGVNVLTGDGIIKIKTVIKDGNELLASSVLNKLKTKLK